jgi:tight adherence protein C
VNGLAIAAGLVVALAVRRLLLVDSTLALLASLRKVESGAGSRSFSVRWGKATLTFPHWQVTVVLAFMLLDPTVAIAVGLLVLARAIGAPSRSKRAELRRWIAAIPDLVELIRLALTSGCTTHLAFTLIAKHANGPVKEMLRRSNALLDEGASISDVLIALQAQVGPPIRPLCSCLLGSERYGLPVSSTLDALAVEARLARQREAEMRSRRLPVLLIFPLVLCILPAFALLTVVPLLGGGLSSLSW